MKTRIEFSTREFYFSHGRTPKGFGSWAFQVGNEQEWVHQSNYGDAKREVVRRLRDRAGLGSYVLVEVLP